METLRESNKLSPIKMDGLYVPYCVGGSKNAYAMQVDERKFPQGMTLCILYIRQKGPLKCARNVGKKIV